MYDTESTKTIGLTNKIRAERSRPRCEVFWNNEILNTLAAIRNSPNQGEAEKLIDYLLSPDVERRLAEGASAQIPLNRTDKLGSRAGGPGVTSAMKVDFHAAATQWPAAQTFVSTGFLGPGG